MRRAIAYCHRSRSILIHTKLLALRLYHGYEIKYIYRPVVPGDARGAIVPPNFGRSVNPIQTKGGRLCPPNITGTPGFSNLPTAENYTYLLQNEHLKTAQ